MQSKHQILRNFTPVAVFSLLGSLMGIVVETSIAAKLGLSESSDAFYVAFTLPYILANLIYSTGQFSLVPFFSSLKTQGEDKLWGGFPYVVKVVLGGAIGVTLVGVVATPLLVRVIAPGLSPAQKEQAAQWGAWLFLIVVPAGVAVASAAGLFRNVTVVASIWLTFASYGGYSIVFGYLAGYLVQVTALSIQLFASFRVRYLTAPEGIAFRHLRGATGAQLASAGTWQGLVLVERVLASFLPAGSLTALNYGFKILATLSGLLVGSLGTAVLPSLSVAAARKSAEEEQRTFRHTLELTLMAVTPLMVLCLMLNQEIIRFIFQRGEFSREATHLMAQVFFWYSLSLICYSFLRSLNFYFFARAEGWVFYRLFLMQCLLAAGSYLVFFSLGLGILSIPLGLLAALTLTTLAVFIRNLGGLRFLMDKHFARLATLLLGGSLLTWLTIRLLRPGMTPPATGLDYFFYLAILSAAGAGVFLLTLGIDKWVRFRFASGRRG